MLQSMTQPRYCMLDLELIMLMVVPSNTTLKSEILLYLCFEAKSIDSHFPGCNEFVFNELIIYIPITANTGKGPNRLVGHHKLFHVHLSWLALTDTI